MTLYDALMRTRFAMKGWVIIFPDGEEDSYEFIEQALGELMVKNPAILTCEVTCMTYFTESAHGDNYIADDNGYFKIELSYGEAYASNLVEWLHGRRSISNSALIREVMEILGDCLEKAEHLTLGEISRIAEICGPSINMHDVIEYLGF